MKLPAKYLVVLLALLNFLSGPSVAQSLPACTHQYYDADGDGYGWQNNASCIVTASTTPPPTYINQSNGAQVNLARPYWDGNADIANRTIQCDRYDYQTATGIYESVAESNSSIPASLKFEHYSIVTSRPFNTLYQTHENVGWYRVGFIVPTTYLYPLSTEQLPFWTVEDGLYQSAELLASPYIELAQTDASSSAVRIWFNEGELFSTGYEYMEKVHRSDGYFECYDPAGADFTPTGAIGVSSAAAEPVLSDIVLTVQADPDANSDIYNRETGELVPLAAAYWDYNNDLAGRGITCVNYLYSEECNGYQRGCGGSDPEPHYMHFGWILNGSESSLDYARQTQGREGNGFISINNGVIEGNYPQVLLSDKVELIGNDSVRIWNEFEPFEGAETKSEYFLCDVQPTGSADSHNTASGNTPRTEVTNNNNDGSQTSAEAGESTSQSGGGSIWLPLLILLLSFRRNAL